MNIQHSDFANRIARIEAGENSFKSTIFVGADETYHPAEIKAAFRKKPVRMTKEVKVQSPRGAKKRGSVLAMPLAFLIGAVALVLWRMTDFQMHGVASLGADPMKMLAVNAATGMALAILICQATSLTAPQHILAAFLGLVAMSFGLPNLVEIAPDQFGQIFSPAWVGQLLAMNGPAQLILG
jgi:hypothetical protein